MPIGDERVEKDLLPKRERLKRGRIKEILKWKRYQFSSPLLRFVAAENNLPYSRLAITTSRDLGSAVRRNYVRRLVVGAYCKIRRSIAKNVDIVIIPRTNLLTLDRVEFLLLEGLKKCGLL